MLHSFYKYGSFTTSCVPFECYYYLILLFCLFTSKCLATNCHTVPTQGVLHQNNSISKFLSLSRNLFSIKTAPLKATATHTSFPSTVHHSHIVPTYLHFKQQQQRTLTQRFTSWIVDWYFSFPTCMCN